MTYILTHDLLGVTPIDYFLVYTASSRYTIEGTKTEARDTIVTLEEIIIVIGYVNLKPLH